MLAASINSAMRLSSLCGERLISGADDLVEQNDFGLYSPC